MNAVLTRKRLRLFFPRHVRLSPPIFSTLLSDYLLKCTRELCFSEIIFKVFYYRIVTRHNCQTRKVRQTEPGHPGRFVFLASVPRVKFKHPVEQTGTKWRESSVPQTELGARSPPWGCRVQRDSPDGSPWSSSLAGWSPWRAPPRLVPGIPAVEGGMEGIAASPWAGFSI